MVPKRCDTMADMVRGAGAIYPGGARAPPPTFESGGARGGTGLEELQTPSGRLTI